VTADLKLAAALKTLKEAGRDVGGTFVDPGGTVHMWLAPRRKSSGWLKMRKHATGKSRKRNIEADINQNERRERTKSGQPRPQTRLLWTNR
jgi:hypothetical protein